MTKDGSPEDHEKRGGKQKKDAVPLTGAAKRANKAEEERKRRIAELRKEASALAEVSRKVREENEEHTKLQNEAASAMMTCWSSLKAAKSSLESAQVSLV